MLFGIDVIIVAPGAVKTPIWSKSEDIDVSRYANSPYYPVLQNVRAFVAQLAATGLPAERIAEVIATALTAAKPKTRYQITPDPMRHLIIALLPKRVGDRIIAKRLGLLPAG
jgi:short-subunit dehydrogenase